MHNGDATWDNFRLVRVYLDYRYLTFCWLVLLGMYLGILSNYELGQNRAKKLMTGYKITIYIYTVGFVSSCVNKRIFNLISFSLIFCNM